MRLLLRLVLCGGFFGGLLGSSSGCTGIQVAASDVESWVKTGVASGVSATATALRPLVADLAKELKNAAEDKAVALANAWATSHAPAPGQTPHTPYELAAVALLALVHAYTARKNAADSHATTRDAHDTTENVSAQLIGLMGKAGLADPLATFLPLATPSVTPTPANPHPS